MTGLREEQRGAARWLILDRPAQRNALTAELIGGLRDALERADGDGQVRAICLTGSGEKAFCSGMDLASAGRRCRRERWRRTRAGAGTRRCSPIFRAWASRWWRR